MIEINLLPEDLRKQKKMDLKLDLEVIGKVKFLAGGVFAGIVIFIIIFLFAGSSIRKKQIIGLMMKEQAISAEKTRAEEANKEIIFLMAKMTELDEIMKRKFNWSRKLNELSDLVLPGIWLTRIYTDAEDRLIIEGSVVSKKEEAMATVGKFMKDIRGNELFFKDFSNIKLESVQRKGTGDRDVVDYRVVLYF
ncbi:MAG: PilN domain-containing protein [Candidatus Omnitrophica bacterium]|nr:PilN domain-containing protein [Candidatus Omnitrophota bacterium]